MKTEQFCALCGVSSSKAKLKAIKSAPDGTKIYLCKGGCKKGEA